MTDDHARLANLIGPCPQCGNGRMVAVVDAEGATNLLCRACGSCWHAEFEWSRRVDPLTCPGCPARDICETVRPPSDVTLPQLT